MRRKRKKPLPRGKLRDNSKSISVRMTEEQFQRLERYRELPRLPVTTYFRKLIAESEIVERPSRIRFRLHEEVNKIDSNIRQILRNPRAKELDREAADRIRFLLEHILEQAYHINAYHDGQNTPARAPCAAPCGGLPHRAAPCPSPPAEAPTGGVWANSIQITQGEPMEQKANITIDKEHITVERTQTACGREIRVISVFPRHGSETVEDKLKALAELDFRQGKLCA